jgi:hypothetical protein
MDDVVRQAMAKWPNVPHCFGWLKLDARGHWRMRDERAQHLDLPGDKIAHPALLGFINRNYTHDEQGRWYFQNGPQRVYVDLELTPYVVRTDPVVGFITQTGDTLEAISEAWMTREGQVVLASEKVVAALDDRDAAAVLATLTVAGRVASDEEIMEWLEGSDAVALAFPEGGNELPLQRISADKLAGQFGFVTQPRATRLTRSE